MKHKYYHILYLRLHFQILLEEFRTDVCFSILHLIDVITFIIIICGCT